MEVKSVWQLVLNAGGLKGEGSTPTGKSICFATMGSRVLQVETAVVAVLGILRAMLLIRNAVGSEEMINW